MEPVVSSDKDVSWGEQYWLGSTYKEVDMVKTIVGHTYVSALVFREVFRIRSRKVMISEIRLDVIRQRMKNFKSKSRYNVSTDRVR